VTGQQRESEALMVAVEAAERWAIFDPSASTRGELDRLVDAADPALVDLFDGRLAFGTAGLRAAVGPGPNRMNALVVRQTTAAVVSWLRDQGVASPVIVIGYDARADSADFARHAAAATRAVGGRVQLADQPLPTPVVAHRLLQTDADAAIVITASHNPAADNGYKLYLGDGIQLVSPADEQIAERIEQIAASWSQWATAIDDAFPDVAATHVADEWEAEHRAAAVAATFGGARELTVAYTPMHGVGGMPIVRAFRAAGFADPLIVESQFEPDPQFSTVAFPNPEEPGAMDRAIAVAVAEHADVVIANDPDADRLALAVPARDGDGFVALTGNQVGALLADHVLRNTSGDRVVARSVVSSRLLDRMAQSVDGVTPVVSLTGFKWVARPIVTHASMAYVFGFEEALGYCIGSHVRDKDGITAALVAAELLADLKARGRTVWDRLDELDREHGVHRTGAVTVRFDQDPSRAVEIVQLLSDQMPAAVGDVAVARSGEIGFGALPSTPGVHLELVDETQIIVRPSGTEPKLKGYVEVIEPVKDTLVAAQALAEQRLQSVVAALQALLQSPS